MNTNNKSRWLGITIILLLLINAATIVFLLMGKDRHQQIPPNGGAFEFLVKELNLDSNQKSEYKKLRDQHRNRVDGLRLQLKHNKDSLFNLLKISDVADVNVNRRLDSIALLNRKIDEITYSHFKQVRAICSVQQQKKFDAVIAQAMQIMQAPKEQHPPHRPPPDGDRPPRDSEPEDGPPHP